MLRDLWLWVKALFSRMAPSKGFLCDTCRYDYRGACDNPSRPNVKSCPDYKRR